MNERIKELMETESSILFPGTNIVDCQIEDIQKFAKLIIGHCALQCWHNDDMDRILEYFGVEE